jgi:hypothetical protein
LLSPPQIKSAIVTLARPHANHVALLRVRSLAGHDTANAARYKVDLTFLQCKSESDFIKVGECPLDPGGYFIIKVFTQNCSSCASAFLCT